MAPTVRAASLRGFAGALRRSSWLSFLSPLANIHRSKSRSSCRAGGDPCHLTLMLEFMTEQKKVQIGLDKAQLS